MVDFASALQSARRRARIAGRPLSKAETAGIAESFAQEASVKAGQKLQVQELEKQRQERQEAIRKGEEAAARAEKAQSTREKHEAAGAVAGGAVGGVFGGPVGAAVGSQVGAAAGPVLVPAFEKVNVGMDIVEKGGEFIEETEDKDLAKIALNPVAGLTDLASDSCIIVTACTSHDSPEVELTREYRDTFLTRSQVIGYYWLASLIVPFINKSCIIKAIVKKILVDRLIDHGYVELGYYEKRKHITSKIVSEFFLSVCNVMGFIKDELSKEVQANG